MAEAWEIPWSLEVGVHTDVGPVRSRNEDAARARVDPALFAVADGLGGHRGGHRASRVAVEVLDRVVSEARAQGEPPGPDLLRRGFEAANAEILQEAAARPHWRGMGTTLTALLLAGGDYWIGHVGDSRALRLRGGTLEQLTRDHSLVAERVARGELSPQAARVHPWRHVLVRCLGCEPAPEVDLLHGQVQPGDLFVLATDGLTGALSPAMIVSAVRDAGGPAAASRRLVQMAALADGRDNATAVVVACRPGP